MTIEGEVIGVNQMTDQAWAYGPGKLVQLTDRGLLTDKAEGEDAASDPNAPATSRTPSRPRSRRRASHQAEAQDPGRQGADRRRFRW